MFKEKEIEEGLPVWQSPKYKESKNKALEMINNSNYGLTEGDFWILMNKNKAKTTMCYTGLIISHNGCLKINDVLESKVNPKCFTLDKEGYEKSLVYTYIDEDVYEVGEVNKDNCQNKYPYAMAFKRCFDRVVLKKSKLAFDGIYSEAEADEFKDPHEVEEETSETPKEKKTEAKKYNKHSQKKREEIVKKVNENHSSKAFGYLSNLMKDKSFSPKTCSDEVFDEINKLLYQDAISTGEWVEPIKEFY